MKKQKRSEKETALRGRGGRAKTPAAVKEQRSIAFHEAGHAVAAYLNGETIIEGLSIIPDNVSMGRMRPGHRYYVGPLQVFGGYEYIWQNNPSNPLGVGATDQGGYIMSGVEDNNLDSQKLVQIWWTAVKYTFRGKTDFTVAWYQQRQNDFRAQEMLWQLSSNVSKPLGK